MTANSNPQDTTEERCKEDDQSKNHIGGTRRQLIFNSKHLDDESNLNTKSASYSLPAQK